MNLITPFAIVSATVRGITTPERLAYLLRTFEDRSRVVEGAYGADDPNEICVLIVTHDEQEVRRAANFCQQECALMVDANGRGYLLYADADRPNKELGKWRICGAHEKPEAYTLIDGVRYVCD